MQTSKRILPYLGELFLLVLPFFLFSSHWISSDEGHVLNDAWQMWNGQRMYVDFYQQVPPGAAVFVLSFWKLFGHASYFIAKIASIIFWIVSAYGIAQIVKHLKGGLLATFLAALVWMVANVFYPLINYNNYSSFAAIWATYFFLRALETQRPSFCFWSGVLTGTATFFLHTKGLVLAGGLFFWFFLGRRNANPQKARLFDLCLAGFLLPLVPLGIFWNAKAVLYNLFFYTFDYRINFGHTVFSTPTFLTEVGILFIMFLAAYRRKEKAWTTLGVIQTLLLLSYPHVHDWHHAVINLFPFYIFAACLFESFLQKIRTVWIRSLLAWAVTLSLCYNVVSGAVFFMFIAKDYASANIYRMDLFGRKKNSFFALLNSPTIQKAKAIYAGPFLPSFYFETKKFNPFKQSAFFECPIRCQEETLSTLHQIKPDFVFWKEQFDPYVRYNPRNPIALYIRRNYKSCGFYGTDVELLAIDRCPDSEVPEPKR